MNLLKSALSDVIKSTDGPYRSETSLHPLISRPNLFLVSFLKNEAISNFFSLTQSKLVK